MNEKELKIHFTPGHVEVVQENVDIPYRRVLVTGATGLLGRAVYKEFQNNAWHALGCGYRRAQPRFLRCNLTDEDAVRAVVQDFQPHVIVHCAAERRPDVVEHHTEAALNLNVHASGTLAKEAGGSALLSESYTLRIHDAHCTISGVACIQFVIYTEQKHKGLSHGWAWDSIGQPTGEPGPTNQNLFFPTKGLYYRQKYSSAAPPPPQTIPQVKKLNVEVLGWRGYTWSAVVRPVGHTAKFSKTTLEVAYAGIFLIYISTDYVFDGRNPPYGENDAPNPLNVYGKSKLEGEREVLRHSPGAAVLRVPILYGEVERVDESAVTVLWDKVQEGAESCSVEHCQQRFPTYVNDVARVCRQMAERRLQDPSIRGIFHYSGKEQMTKYEMACAIADAFNLPSSHLIPMTEQPAGAGAQRPQNAQLECSRLELLGFGVEPIPFKTAVRDSLWPFLYDKRWRQTVFH